VGSDPKKITLANLGASLISAGGVAAAAHNHNTEYLGLSAQAYDSARLGGQLPAYYAPATHLHAGVYEPVIARGTTTEYFRGDLSRATLNQAAVAGLKTSDSPTFAGLGIATTTPKAALHTVGDLTITGGLYTGGSASAKGSPRIDANGAATLGNTTCGTLTTSGNASVVVSAGAASLSLQGAGTATTKAALAFNGSNGTATAPTDVTDGQAHGLNFNYWFNGAWRTACQVQTVVQGTPTPGGSGVPGLMRFNTMNAGGGLSTRFSIDKDGLIGIRNALHFTTTPGAPAEGDWLIQRNGANLEFSRYVGGTWVLKGSFAG
jgi:hypothetical protein